MKKYIVKGDVRGIVSEHNKLSAAIRSMKKDERDCANLPGGNSYSDVMIERTDGEELTNSEAEEIFAS
jgi:hypothetical protein